MLRLGALLGAAVGAVVSFAPALTLAAYVIAVMAVIVIGVVSAQAR
jgi:hypothetical protein